MTPDTISQIGIATAFIGLLIKVIFNSDALSFIVTVAGLLVFGLGILTAVFSQYYPTI